MYGSKQMIMRWLIAAIAFTTGMLPAVMVKADPGEWTWTGGSDMVAQAGIYGTKGTPDAANVPGGRYESVSWKDNVGNLWLFGGYGLDSVGKDDLLNDLWRYDPDNGTWTWMSGADTVLQEGICGIKGMPDAANVPGARYGSVAWTDSTGNFWLFGGYGLDNATREDYLNDLWRYDPDTGLWTWISGSARIAEEGTYGTKGEPDADNVPGARYGSFGWIDSGNNLWLFGGLGYDDEYQGLLSDLWRYDPDNETWTWISGFDRVAKKGTYGIQGITAEKNVPGGRYTGSSWMDNTGNLWLFGGVGYAGTRRPDLLNDLWRYSPGTDRWIWISGANTAAKPGIYGTKGTPDAANVPGARDGSVAWMDIAGNLRLFGGYGIDGYKAEDYLNDMWSFELPTDRHIRIDTCKIKAGTTDSIKLTGWMDAGEAVINAAMDGEIVICLLADEVPDPDATTFRFPIDAGTFTNGIYKSPKVKPADKNAPVQSFFYDSAKSTLKFSAQNVDLTGLSCPITLMVQIGAYIVEVQLDEAIVNGPNKPCPLALMMGVLDSLDVQKFKAKNSSTAGADTVLISGTFTVDGSFDFNTALPVDSTLGLDTFSVPGGEFLQKNGVYSCKNVASGNGRVTAKFDTVKCRYSIKIKDATFSGSGNVDFSIDLFGNALQYPDQVELP